MKKSTVYLIHSFFWASYFLLLFIILAAATQGFSTGPNLSYILKLGILFVLLPAFGSFYLFYFYLFPNYIKTRKIVRSFVYGLLISFSFAIIAGLFLLWLLGEKIFLEGGFQSLIAFLFSMTMMGLLTGAMSIVIRGFITWYHEIKVKEELTVKNHQIELALVKSQLDPHFLFNTINNIDVLIGKDASRASEYLNHLSDILRFMLFEIKSDKISLSKEIEYMDKYIALQKLRTSNKNFVRFTVQGDTSNQMISPMLFIPLVENAFKHVSNKKEENAITITLTMYDQKIVFECENMYDENHTTLNEFNGLGNELLRKRIELMYPNKHKLSITNQKNLYHVKLELSNE